MSQDRDGRRSPCLPQHTPADDWPARARALGKARERYVWTTQVETLPGVPLATKVHVADEPSVPWLLATAKVALGVAENAVAVKLHERGEQFGEDHPAVQKLQKLRDELQEVEARHEAAHSTRSLAEGGLEGIFERLRGSVGVALGAHEDEVDGHLDALMALVDEHELARSSAAALGDYRALFRTEPLPRIADVFMRDRVFAELRLAGPNAVLIARCDAIPEKLGFTAEDYQAVMGSDDSLAAALDEGRLFLLDYAELASLVPGTSEGRQKFLWCPVAVFAVPAGGGPLEPVAIQLDQAPAPGTLHLRPAADSGPDWSWEMAKFAVQVADGNHHELFVHLARTHLVMEAVAIATHRALAPTHPLYLLLVPHVQGTLFINNAAAGGLIAADGPIDRIFAGTIETTQLAAVHDRLGFAFTARMLPHDLARRGVTDTEVLPRYPYRDDAQRVWGAIRGWVGDYVGAYYTGDGDVVGDTELAAFVAELRGSGKLADLAPIETVDALVDALTMMIFTGSAQHAAVNFPQRSIMSYAPAVTGAAWAEVAAPGAAASEDDFVGMMPPLDLAMQQLNTLFALGGVYFTKLGDYKAAGFPYDDWFADPAIVRDGGPLERFRNALREVEAAIDRDSKERPLAYPYLLPSQIPESINI